MSDDQSFIKQASESAAGLWLGLWANLIQVGEWVYGEFVAGSDSDRVLALLNEINDQITLDYFSLRHLIEEQTAQILEEIDTNTQREFLAYAQTAYDNLQEYLRSGNRNILEMAFTLSDEAVNFFLHPERSMPLPGSGPPMPSPWTRPPFASVSTVGSFAYCVTVRLAILRSFIRPAYYTQALYIDQIRQYIQHLNDIIAYVTKNVEDSHVTVETSVSIGRDPQHGFTSLRFVHYQNVLRYPELGASDDNPLIPVQISFVEWNRIPYNPNRDPVFPTEDDARTEIERDRSRGIQQELEFLGVPEMRAVRDTWIRLLPPLHGPYARTPPHPSI